MSDQKPVHLADLLKPIGIKCVAVPVEGTGNREILRRITGVGLGNLVTEERVKLWTAFKRGDIVIVRECPCGKCGSRSIETIECE